MKIICIPDTQCKKGVDMRHLNALGNYIVDKKPDVVVSIGDHWDMPSLGTHNDRGHISYENARMQDDLEAGTEGMERLLTPLFNYNDNRRRNKQSLYVPRLVFCRGNHENRRQRLLDQEPILRGALADFDIERFGWEDHEFLKPVRIEGVNFCHYATSGVMQRPVSRAQQIATNKHESWVVGHQQGLDIYFHPFAKTDGSRVQCIIAGSFYQHDETYMTPQGNQHWRGALYLTEAQNGTFDLVTLSISYLLRNWA